MRSKRFIPLFVALLATLILGFSSVHAAGATFVVNTTADGNDTNIMDGVCKTASGMCSLRAAIQQANNMLEKPSIRFAINSGAQTLRFSSSLPEITRPMLIDATTQPGFSGKPIITLDGAYVPEVYQTLDAGFYITGGNTTVKGFIIINFIEGGIVLYGGGNNRIQGNYIGTNGTTAYGNPDNGIRIENSSYNVIGGLNAADRNVISGNAWDGIALDEGASNTQIQGNVIGLDATGTAVMSNGSYGIDIYAFSVDINNVLIGGAGAGARNIVSGNGRGGIHVYAGMTYGRVDNLLIQGNYIGTDITGTQDRGNAEDGLFISNTVNTRLLNNVISGNNQNGIRLSETKSTVIQGNHIGANAAGNAAIGNTQDGIEVYNYASNVLIGGPNEGMGNIIGGNGNNGIYLISAFTPVIQGNLIGTTAQGVAIGNQYSGIYISDTVDSMSVGEPQHPNAIAYNNKAGVSVFGTSNAIRGNAIYDNFEIGIDLLIPNKLFDDKGVTTNDTGDGDTGGNNLQNYPVLKSAELSNGLVRVNGTLNSTRSNSYILDFYASPVCDPSGHGEGMFYLGALYNQNTDSNGNLSFSASLALNNPALKFITVTATDSGNNTSEFSACIKAGNSSASTGLLTNGGFETAGATKKLATGWKAKNLIKDGRKCNKDMTGDGDTNDPEDKVFSRSGKCAVMLQVRSTSQVKLKQVNSTMQTNSGGILTLNAYIAGKKLKNAGVMLLTAKYADGTVQKDTVNIADGTYGYSKISATLNLIGDVDKVMVQFKTRLGSGKVLIDDVALIYGQAQATNGLLPLPPAP